MRTGTVVSLISGLALALGLAGSVAAQPTAKAYLLDDAMRQTLWCSAVLYEESFLYAEGSVWPEYYDALSWELDDSLYGVLVKKGVTDAQYSDLWSLFQGEAYALSATDDELFLGEVIACEEEYGHLIPRPDV